MKNFPNFADHALPYLAGNPQHTLAMVRLGAEACLLETPLDPDVRRVQRLPASWIRQLHMTPGWCLEQRRVLNFRRIQRDSLEYPYIKENTSFETFSYVTTLNSYLTEDISGPMKITFQAA